MFKHQNIGQKIGNGQKLKTINMLKDILQALLIVAAIFSFLSGLAGSSTKIGFLGGIILGWKVYGWKYLAFFIFLIIIGVISGIFTIN